ncbi:MAG: reverse transcriptase domain-containing protein [Dyadobacter sp.]
MHLTRQINVGKERAEVLGKVSNPVFVQKHAFFPLIHTNIKVRRFKIAEGRDVRSHSFAGKSHSKLRPLHYATHIDSMIFGYYGEQIQKAYLQELESTEYLCDCVTAYRRIENGAKSKSYKSTIHFAHEVFEEIRKRSEDHCWVLKFDIEKFFSSMDHKLLRQAWMQIFGYTTLPQDHYNVFKATTQFHYILRDDLRVRKGSFGFRSGFDEKNLAEIRKDNVSAFFDSPTSFRKAVKDGRFKIYKNQFINSTGKVVGIPQGLPISATLANLYLLKFDKDIVDEIVVKRGGYYRRYSDDIIIICNDVDKEFILKYIENALKSDSKVEISKDKTEQFFFTTIIQADSSRKVTCNLFKDGAWLSDRALTYLGFEFYGYKTLIKSANLSKFYRRLILAVKSRSKRAALAAEKNPVSPNALFKRRLYKLYTNINLDKIKTRRRFKILTYNRYGRFVYSGKQLEEEFKSNYFTYVKRASQIMNEPKILNQVRRHRTIFDQAVKKYFTDSVRR